ncbi:MAG: MFS transporter, partial [Pseudomonadales bacterium]|nr:MFS transporter [Pseudomonadales bacterium]
PIGLISIALPAWLAEQGASTAEIASFIAISGLPWGFKLVAGPVMDRFSFLAMGRRRPWVVGAQFLLLAAMIAMGFVPDPANHIVLLTWLAFLVNCGAAVQDVAVDGMAIDVLPVEERGRANAFMAFGQVAGYSGSAALSAMALVSLGLPGATLSLAGGILFIFVWAVLVRERSGERRLPWTPGEATARSIELQAEDWRSIFANLRKVVFLPASVILVAMTFCWRATDGFWLTAAPVIAVQQLGYASTEYSNWNAIVGFAAATAGLLIGPVIDRRGSQRILFGALAILAGIYLTVFLTVPLWTESWLPLLVLIIQQFVVQALFISFIATHMNIC